MGVSISLGTDLGAGSDAGLANLGFCLGIALGTTADDVCACNFRGFDVLCILDVSLLGR